MNLLWAPMPAPVPVNLNVGQRIVLKLAAGGPDHFALERTVWGWNLRRFGCEKPATVAGSPVSGVISGAICTLKWYEAPTPIRASVVALLNLAPGSKESAILTSQIVGILPGAPAVASGFLFTRLDAGQSIELLGGRRLVVGPVFGIPRLQLLEGDKWIGQWNAGARLLLDGKGQVTVLAEIGVHQADNWGMPVASLP